MNERESEWPTALGAHRHRHYHTYRACEELLKIVKEVGDDPGLRAGVEHLRALLVTANDRHLLATCPEAARHRSWSETGRYLTADELRVLQGKGEQDTNSAEKFPAEKSAMGLVTNDNHRNETVGR